DKLNLLPTPIPQLYILGEEDFLFKRFTPRLVARIKGAGTIFLENAGHICNIEQRREFNRISLEFFEKNSI
ncbi:MAG: alpha/beta fold hydrolase, partial [Eubacteriales bacterium]